MIKTSAFKTSSRKGALGALFALLVAFFSFSAFSANALAETADYTFQPMKISFTPVVGTSASFELRDSFEPSEENWDYYRQFSWQEDFDAKWASGCFTVSSSNEAVVKAEIIENEYQQFQPKLILSYCGSGTATVILQYLFEGQYNTYSASQSIEVTVAQSSIPITSVSSIEGLDNGVLQHSIVTSCPICNGSHGHLKGDDLVVRTAPANATSDASIWLSPDDLNVFEATIERRSDTTFGIDVTAMSVGETTVKVMGPAQDDSGNFVVLSSFKVKVTEALEPVIESNDFEVDTLYYGVDEYEYSGEVVITPAIYPDFMGVRYVENEYLQLLNDGPLPDENGGNMSGCSFFIDGNQYVNGTKVFECEITQGNQFYELARDRRDNYVIRPIAEGTGTLTFTDIWDNTATCKVNVFSFAERDAKEYSLNETAIEIGVGEYVDLRQYIDGTATNDLYMFQSSDESIATTHWGAKEISEMNDMYMATGAFRVLGRSPGEVTLSVGLLNDYEVVSTLISGPDLNDPYASKAKTAPFGTLTVRVVDKSDQGGIVEGTGREDVDVDIFDSSDYAEGEIGDIVDAGGTFYVGHPKFSDQSLNNLLEKEGFSAVVEKLDFHFLNAQGEVVPFGDEGNYETRLVVRIALTDEMRKYTKGTFKVFYVNEDEERYSEVDAWVQGDYIYVFTNHFSDFVVVSDTLPDNQGGGDASGGTGGGEGGEGTGGGVVPEADPDTPKDSTKPSGSQSSGDSIAKTGDGSGLTAALFGFGALITAGAIAMARRRMGRAE